MGHLSTPCKVGICGLISVIHLLGVIGLGIPIFQGAKAVEETSDFPWAQGVFGIYGGPRRHFWALQQCVPSQLFTRQQRLLPFELVASLGWDGSVDGMGAAVLGRCLPGCFIAGTHWRDTRKPFALGQGQVHEHQKNVTLSPGLPAPRLSSGKGLLAA